MIKLFTTVIAVVCLAGCKKKKPAEVWVNGYKEDSQGLVHRDLTIKLSDVHSFNWDKDRMVFECLRANGTIICSVYEQKEIDKINDLLGTSRVGNKPMEEEERVID